MFKATQTHNHVCLLTQPKEGMVGNPMGETMPQAPESPWEEEPEPPEFTYHVTLGVPSLSFELQSPTVKSLEDQRTVLLWRERV